MNKFRVVVADPPWDFKGGCWDRQSSRASSKYPTLTFEDICSLPFTDVMSEDSYCFVWTTNRHGGRGLGAQVLEAWGFRYMTMLTWPKPRMGLGYYFRNNTEHIVLGVKGSPGKFDRRDVLTELPDWPVRSHSEKPHEFYEDLIPTLTRGPYLELFAREEREGWTTWGNELEDTLGIGFDPKQW